MPIFTSPIGIYQPAGHMASGIQALSTSINIATPGVFTVVDAVPGKQIAIVQCALGNGSQNSVLTLQSHVTTAQAMGPFDLSANLMLLLPFSPIGWFVTIVGEALDLSFTGGTVGGILSYVVL